MTRRSTFTDQSVTYGAIGATLAPDLLRYPPAGYRPSEDAVRLGSGLARFERAAEALMTWGIQRGSGFEVSDISTGTGAQYPGIVYDAEGAPLAEQIPVLIVYVIDEPGRMGFAYGTTAEGPESGEESFIVEHRDDDTVWLTIRSIFATTGVTAPMQRKRRRELTRLELRALHPAGGV